MSKDAESDSKYFGKLRRHQEAARQRALQIVAGTVKRDPLVVSSKVSCMHSTTGTGKTFAYAVHAGVLLSAAVVDRVCIVVPRSSLVGQIASGFYHPIHCPYMARKADNTEPLIRDAHKGRICYVTTYQAIAADPGVHEREFRNGRWLLILDEVHHLGEDDSEMRAWAIAIEKLVARAQWVFCGTGTLNRHDEIRIPFLRYETRGGLHYPCADITYTRREAIADRVIVPIFFNEWDGDAEWEEERGEKKIRRRRELSRNGSHKDRRTAVRMTTEALGYRDSIIRESVKVWQQRRRETGYYARMIIIAASQSMASAIRDFVRDTFHLSTVLAITQEGPKGKERLEAFRKGTGDVLITVGMAYEGLDVPDAKFMVCLTDKRSVPWLEQAFGRLVRHDTDSCLAYERQEGIAWVPKDPDMLEIIEAIRLEQRLGIDDRQSGEGHGGGGPGTDHIKPISCEMTSLTVETLAYGPVSDADKAEIDRLKNTHEIFKYAPYEHCVKYLHELRAKGQGQVNGGTHDTRVHGPPPDLGVDEENRLRGRIEDLGRKIDSEFLNGKFGSTNKRLKKKFAKSREVMGVTELQEVLTFLQDRYQKLKEKDRAAHEALS